MLVTSESYSAIILLGKTSTPDCYFLPLNLLSSKNFLYALRASVVNYCAFQNSFHSFNRISVVFRRDNFNCQIPVLPSSDKRSLKHEAGSKKLEAGIPAFWSRISKRARHTCIRGRPCRMVAFESEPFGWSDSIALYFRARASSFYPNSFSGSPASTVSQIRDGLGNVGAYVGKFNGFGFYPSGSLAIPGDFCKG